MALALSTVNPLQCTNLMQGYATTVTAGGTTTLTAASTYAQFFTGTAAQTVVLPAVGTLKNGYGFQISNRSTGVVTVQTSTLLLVQSVLSGKSIVLTCVNEAGTNVAADWYLIGGPVTDVSTSIPALVIPNNLGAQLKGVPIGGLYRSALNGATTSLTFSITASFVAAGTTLTVTVAGGFITPGMFLTGGTVTSGTQILAQLTGTAGGIGTYQVDQAQLIAVAPTGVRYNSTVNSDIIYVRTV